jgi:putative Mg2+ transporter-C (MgtC) family protein
MFGPAIEAWDASLNQWFQSLGAPVEDVARLAIAAIFGGLVGVEREIRGRQAGFRTCLLVCVGSALVMLVSIEFARHQWTHPSSINLNIDPARIAYGVMTGIGFLCAGVIIKHENNIRGLTTAAGIWCVAAIGLSIGFGMYLLSTLATVIVVGALWLLDYLGNGLPKTRHRRIVVRFPYRADSVQAVVKFVREAGLHVAETGLSRTGDLKNADITVTIAYKSEDSFQSLLRRLAAENEFELISINDS